MSKYYYCEICGQQVIRNQNICPKCKNYICPKESLHDSEYYRNKSMQMVGNYSYATQILIDEEVSQSPKFNPNCTEGNAVAEFNKRNEEIFKPKQDINTPKCPTCGSTNIKKISSVSKAAHGLAFGLFSKTARSQFECLNCHYKW